MYRDAYQRGMLTIFFSVGSKPLAIWETHIKNGYIARFLDQDIKSMVLEIGGCNVSTTYMICPKGNAVLGITMPFLVMIVKNLHKYFSFEVTILDDTGTRRRFRVANFQTTTQVQQLCTVMPIGLTDGWNQIQFNLAEFTRRAYNKQFIEVQKLKINANIRLRRIYFAERLIAEDQLPSEYKLFFPLVSKGKKMPDQITEKQDVVTPHAGVGKKVSKLDERSKWHTNPISLQTIKDPVHEPPFEQKSSQMFKVKEDSLERLNAIADLEISRGNVVEQNVEQKRSEKKIESSGQDQIMQENENKEEEIKGESDTTVGREPIPDTDKEAELKGESDTIVEGESIPDANKIEGVEDDPSIIEDFDSLPEMEEVDTTD